MPTSWIRPLTVRSEGRHRYYSLASADVASALECLARLSLPFRPNSLRSHRRSCSLKAARTGRGPTAYRITPAGQELFGAIDVTVHDTGGPPVTVRHCVDWTSDRHHLAGRLGASVLSSFLARGWVARTRDSRILRVGPEGQRAIARWLGTAPESLTCS